jgi:hypothetical protein
LGQSVGGWASTVKELSFSAKRRANGGAQLCARFNFTTIFFKTSGKPMILLFYDAAKTSRLKKKRCHGIFYNLYQIALFLRP